MLKIYTLNSYIYTKNEKTVKNMYKKQTERSFELKMYVFLYKQTMYKLYKIYTAS